MQLRFLIVEIENKKLAKKRSPYMVKAAAKKDDAQSRWINDLVKRRNANIAAVAVANKNARVAWAMLTKLVHYEAPTLVDP